MKASSSAPTRALILGLLASLAAFFVPAAIATAQAPGNGRQWELITPGEPVAAQVVGMLPMGKDDSRIPYATLGPIPGAESGVLLSTTLAERGLFGWDSKPLSFPYSIFSEELLEQLLPMRPTAFSEDRLTSLWLSTVPLTDDAPPEGHAALYLRSPSGEPKLIAGVGEKSLLFESVFTSIAADGSPAFFSSPEHLVPADAGRTEGESIYEWDGVASHQVDVDDGGSLLSACGSTVSSENGISATGTRVFFTNPASETSCVETKRVYLREAGSTTEVSASQCTRVDCNEPRDVAFAGATPSGDHVFLTTSQQLTDDDVDETRDLYRYDVGSGALTLLTPAQPEANGEVSELPVVASPDGARVYFKAIGQVATGAGSPFGENLYLADSSGLHFVAPTTAENRVEVARDGRTALFATGGAMVEEDTDSNEDVYLYDADSSSYTRISSGPTGGNGPFDANIKAPLVEEEFFGEGVHAYHSISEDGHDAFFSTEEKLVPEDANEASDVYEWRDGQVSLVSSGSTTGPSPFGGISADGRTAVFRSSGSLTPDDQDGGDADIYAARIGGGFPLRGNPFLCEGASCQETERAQPETSPPVSALLHLGKRRARVSLRGVRWRGSKSAHPSAIGVTVQIPSPGRVSATVWAQGESGKHAALARGSGGAIRPGKVRLLLPLTGAGKRMLAREEQLSGRLEIRAAGQRLVRQLRLRAGSMG